MLAFKSIQKESSDAKSCWNSMFKVRHSKISHIAGKQLLTFQRTVVPPSSGSRSSRRARVLDPEDEGTAPLQNVSNFLPVNMV